ncbi:MAG: HlyD family efflux transporter periplasmic adaptor subunit [Candidatus Methylumidiphilus sp.]
MTPHAQPPAGEAAGPFSGPLDPAAWRQLQDAPDCEAYAQAWLQLQCAQIAEAARAVVVLGPTEHGPFAPVAFWPAGKGGSLGLTTAAELALHERRGVLRAATEDAPGFCHIAHPLLIDGQLHGVVAIELAVRPEAALRGVMRQLQWGSAWLEVRLRRAAQRPASAGARRLSVVLGWLSTCIESERFQDAATALVTEMATALGCERVSAGLLQGRNIRVRALSHSAQFLHQSSLADSIGAAMDEAMEQRATLAHPPPAGAALRLTECQAKLSRQFGGGAVLTVPISRNGRVVGALTLERPADRPFDAETVELCEAAASLAGPILADKFNEDRWLAVKAWHVGLGHMGRLFGPGHPGLKLAAILAVALALFLTLSTGDYRVTADTRVEGEIQRVVAAPLDGYVMEAPARAGDIVRQGALMARLDDRDLLLQRAKWASQREQYLRQHRDALAKSDRAEASVLAAQVGQAEAELALVDEQLARSRVAAPFDGVVVSGDLSQSLGAPVARGDVLFEVAPLDAYRVILEVDEADMKDLRVGQRGKLVLTGESSAVLPFAVGKITAVSESREGRNYFRVEAKLDSAPAFLRPGMKGVGKIDIGERKRLWIWTHKLTDWLRLWLWYFQP